MMGGVVRAFEKIKASVRQVTFVLDRRTEYGGVAAIRLPGGYFNQNHLKGGVTWLAPKINPPHRARGPKNPQLEKMFEENK